MEIDTKPLGISKNLVDVQGSWGQIDQADELMISLYTIDADGDDMVKSLQAERNMMKKAMEFFKNVLGLSAKQVNKVFEEVNGQTMNLYISYVCGLVKGAPYQDFADFQKSVQEASDSAPKAEPEKPEE